MFNHPHYEQTRLYLCMTESSCLTRIFTPWKFNDGVNQSWSVVLAKVNHSPEVGANIEQKDWNQQL